MGVPREEGLAEFGILERLPEMFLRTENFFKRVLLSVLKFFFVVQIESFNNKFDL